MKKKDKRFKNKSEKSARTPKGYSVAMTIFLNHDQAACLHELCKDSVRGDLSRSQRIRVMIADEYGRHLEKKNRNNG